MCEYCHEDRDGYVMPLDKNAHAYYKFPDKLVLKFGREMRECKINFCPMCGRNLRKPLLPDVADIDVGNKEE